MTLTDFLLARIAEDEGRAVIACGSPGDNYHEGADVFFPEGHVDKFRLAECEAKRQAIEAAWADHLRIEGEWGRGQGMGQLEAKNDQPEVVRWLAMPYSDHPAYQEQWKP